MLEMDNRGQVSAEMIVLMAAVLTVALVIISSLNNTAKSSKDSLDNASDNITKKIKNISDLV